MHITMSYVFELFADSFREGIILPTIVTQIRSILHQYPDDGQILKVCIQFPVQYKATLSVADSQTVEKKLEMYLF